MVFRCNEYLASTKLHTLWLSNVAIRTVHNQSQFGLNKHPSHKGQWGTEEIQLMPEL